MEHTESGKTMFSKVDSIKKFVLENGWYIPTLHEKYLVVEDPENP